MSFLAQGVPVIAVIAFVCYCFWVRWADARDLRELAEEDQATRPAGSPRSNIRIIRRPFDWEKD